MSNKHKSFCDCLVPLCATFIGVILALQAAGAQSVRDADPAALAAINAWIKKIDDGRYLECWVTASSQFQKSITSTDWVAGMGRARSPLGACKERRLSSVAPQSEVPDTNGKMLHGEFVVAQFKSSFANLDSAVEMVTFEKEGGVWKASGYILGPGT
jgi:Protein of unknown function (DUF4019)